MSTRVLLTGAGGFIGHHTAEWIMDHTDWELIGLDSWNPKHKGDKFRVSDKLMQHIREGRYRVVTADLSLPISEQLGNHICGVDDCGGVKPLHYIINMASDSHVTRSVIDPRQCWTNNTQLILNMLEFAREYGCEKFLQVSTDEVYGDAGWSGDGHPEWDTIKPSNPYSASKAAQEALAFSYWRTFETPVIITNCYDMQTRVMAQDGLKGYGELQVGDLVWAMDAEERMVLEPVQRLVKMPGGGRMVRFHGDGVDQLVTCNHRMMIRRPTGKSQRWGAIEEVSAESLLGMPGKVRIPRHGEWEGELPVTFEPYRYVSEGRDGFSKMLPERMDSEQVAALFGWYVSRGLLHDDVTVCFEATSLSQQREISAALDGIQGGVYLNGYSVRVVNRHLALLLSLCGDEAKNKRIPEFIRAWGVDLLRGFFEAAIMGSGIQQGEGCDYYTSSLQAAQGMAEVAMKLGYAVRIVERETGDSCASSQPACPFVVHCTSAAGEIEACNVSEERYDGDVWCLSVPSGRVFVERNGAISLSGQTMNVIGERQDPEKYLPMTISKISNGEVVKIHSDSASRIASRVWLDAKNMAAALVYILQNVEPSRYASGRGADLPSRYNVVGETEMNVFDLARLVAQMLRRELKYELVRGDAARPGYDRRYALDGTKLAEAGFQPPYTFRQTIERVVSWFLENPEWTARRKNVVGV